MWKTYNAARSGFWIFGRNIFQREGLSKLVNCFLADSVLHMQVVLCHIYISMAYDTLDSGQVDSQSLHLTNIGVSARVRRQNTYSLNFSDRFLEFVSEV